MSERLPGACKARVSTLSRLKEANVVGTIKSIRLLVLLSLVVALIGSPALGVSQDGFGDGNRDNDAGGVLEGPVDDAADVGWAWYRVFYTAGENQTVTIAHDPGGLGDDNALVVDVTNAQAYMVANIDPVSLVNPGDYVKLTFKFRLVGLIPDNRDTFRFGLFSSNGTVVDADQTGNTMVADDPGYFATLATGAAPNRARIAENGPTPSAGSMFAIDRTLALQDPSLHNINDNLPHTLALEVVRPYGTRALVRYYLDGSLIMQGEDPAGNLFNFNEIGFGVVPTPVVDYNVDDVVIETGNLSGCDVIGSVTVSSPLPVGATQVQVTNIGPETDEVRVYADGALIGTAAGAPPATPLTLVVTTSALVDGAIITAKQAVGGVESCVPLGNSVTVNNCNDVEPVAIATGFRAGDTQLTVLGVVPAAQEVRVYGNGTTLIGSAMPAGADTVVVTVSPALEAGQKVAAVQVVNGVESCKGEGLTVRGSELVLLQDGFGDGDRDNKGALEGPVDDAADVGAAWWLVNDASHTVSIAHDAAGLGDDNALFVVTGATQKYIVARMPEVTLAEVGDFVSMSMDWRLSEVISLRDIFRFGIFHDLGTAVEADQTGSTNVVDDVGYFATLASGNPAAGSRDCRIARAGPPNSAAGTLFGLDEGLLDDETSPYVTNDMNAHTLSITIVRVAVDRVRIDVTYDGNLALTAEDTSDANAPIVTSYNQVAMGGVGGVSGAFIDYVIDNVKVVAQVSSCSDPVFDVDANNRVDLADAAQFLQCATGPMPGDGVFAGLAEECQCLDANGDKAIDMLDFAGFQRCIALDQDADPACDN